MVVVIGVKTDGTGRNTTASNLLLVEVFFLSVRSAGKKLDTRKD